MMDFAAALLDDLYSLAEKYNSGRPKTFLQIRGAFEKVQYSNYIFLYFKFIIHIVCVNFLFP
jgi:hypothetical protein